LPVPDASVRATEAGPVRRSFSNNSAQRAVDVTGNGGERSKPEYAKGVADVEREQK
jgi:hypothetical protein